MPTISIFGLGRSGLAIAKAAIAHGNNAIIYDQASADGLAKPEILGEAKSIGAEVVLNWDGDLPPPGATNLSEVDRSPDPNAQRPTSSAVLVVNPAVDSRSPILAQAQTQGYEVISEVEFAYRISKAPIIAITGTNGKSTTTVMTYLCLKHCGIDAVLCGNIFGSGYPEVPLTQAAMNANEDQILVAEVSSFQLEWISKFRPVSAGITNIWPDHLERYDRFEDYAAAKQRIFGSQTAEDFAIVKAHDPVVKAPGSKPTSRHRRTPAASLEGNFPTVLTFGAAGQHAQVDDRFLTILDKQVKLSDLPFQEPHNFTNAAMAGLLAYGALNALAIRDNESDAGAIIWKAEAESKAKRQAATHAFNQRTQDANAPHFVLPQCIIEGLKEFKGLAHRMEFVGEKDGVRIINNSMCTNPDAVLKSATAVRGPNHILLGGRNKNLDFKPVKHYFASGIHHAYVYGEARQDLSEQIGTSLVYETMEEAFRAAIAKAKSGEVVMLAPGCASTDQFRDFRERGDVFKQLAKEWLES
jgi:UDP-N-acetylmuramoylalanine--D-glutamate ligase